MVKFISLLTICSESLQEGMILLMGEAEKANQV